MPSLIILHEYLTIIIHDSFFQTSPCDGLVVNLGVISDDKIDQIKGVNYSMASFFGPQKYHESPCPTDSNCVRKRLIQDPNNVLYHCVLYLAPGDYHRFHSPVNWQVNFRRHFSGIDQERCFKYHNTNMFLFIFPGLLLSVNPSVVQWINELFALNERVLYTGEWIHGFFSMTAVGATNVGSIRTYFDPVSDLLLMGPRAAEIL